MDYSGNVERFSGFADVYDQYRAAPPAILADILTRMAGVEMPACVVDLGSGTGLSTRYWASRARQVIGIEPSADMRGLAARITPEANVTYREGFADTTGLPDACAEIVTCSQSLHWMDPLPTFQEARRILVHGGVFAAFDYDWPPLTGKWEADRAYQETMRRVWELEKDLPGAKRVKQWDKEGHLSRMQTSGCFRYTREIAVHHADQGNAERLVGLLLSQGGVMALRKQGVSEETIGIDRLRAAAAQYLGDEPGTWYWTSRVRIGVK